MKPVCPGQASLHRLRTTTGPARMRIRPYTGAIGSGASSTVTTDWALAGEKADRG